MNIILENFSDYEFRVSPINNLRFHIFEKSYFIGILYLDQKQWSPQNLVRESLSNEEVEQFKLLLS